MRPSPSTPIAPSSPPRLASPHAAAMVAALGKEVASGTPSAQGRGSNVGQSDSRQLARYLQPVLSPPPSPPPGPGSTGHDGSAQKSESGHTEWHDARLLLRSSSALTSAGRAAASNAAPPAGIQQTSAPEERPAASAPSIPLELPSGGCFADCASCQCAGQLGELRERLGEVLSGPILRLLVSLYQVLRPIGAVFVVRWPPMYTELLDKIGARRRQLEHRSASCTLLLTCSHRACIGAIEFEFVNLDMMPLGCVVRLNAHHGFVLRTAGPLAFIGLLALFAQISKRKWQQAERASRGHEPQARRARSRADFFETSIFLLLFLIYPSTSSAIFNFFLCDRIEDGQRLLSTDYSIHCESPEHLTMRLYAFLMLGLYPFGTPLLYLYCFKRHGRELAALQNREQQRNAVGDDAWYGSYADELESRAAGLPPRHSAPRLSSWTTQGDDTHGDVGPAAKTAEADEKEQRKQELAALPVYIRKMIGPYEFRCYYFEIFECVRKATPLRLEPADQQSSRTRRENLSRPLLPALSLPVTALSDLSYRASRLLSVGRGG